MNLISTKDAIAYQMVASVGPIVSEQNSRYTGPYVSGEEYETLLQAEHQMDEAWKIAQIDLED